MNKRCTNSACRKTFSTLTNGGKCPFCGKIYPQLIRTKKPDKKTLEKMTYPVKKRSVIVRVDGSPMEMDLAMSILNFSNVFWHRQGIKVRGIKAIHDQFVQNGYRPEIFESKFFYLSLVNCRKLPLNWEKTVNYRDEMLEIKPVFRNEEEKYRYYCCQDNSEKILTICRGPRLETYILTNRRIAKDTGLSTSDKWKNRHGISLDTISKVGLFDASGKKTQLPSDCVHITVTGKDMHDKTEMMDLYRATPEFTKLAKFFQEKKWGQS